MARQHLVRFGALGWVGRFTPVDAVRYPRASRVIVRTARGLELGEVLVPLDEPCEHGTADGSIVRGVTAADDLLAARLEQNRQAAWEACSREVARRNLAVTLMEVEHLFDGQTLAFYFLGEVTPEVQALTDELAETYDSAAQIRRFAATLAEGCGPDCGTAAAGGCHDCGTGCAVAAACSAGGTKEPTGRSEREGR